MKRLLALLVLSGALVGLGGCVYGPGYYQRPGVTYDNGAGPVYDNGGSVAYDDDYYAPDYYYGSAYGPYCCYGGWGWGWGWPYVSLGFYGGYGHYHGWHGGGWHGGGWHGGGSHGGGWHGGGHSHH